MSQTKRSAEVRFCPGCGQAAAPGANFCTACGERLRGSAPRAAPGPDASSRRSEVAGLFVLSAFLALGLSLWFLVLAPKPKPQRLPLASKNPDGGAAATTPAASMPADHPPIEIPEEVKTYLAELEAQAKAAPKDAEVWKNVAQVQYRAGQVDPRYLERAESSYRHLLEIDPKSPDALRGLGNVAFDRDQYDKAIERYREYLELKPEDVHVRTDLGTMYLYSREPDRAIAEYEKAIAKDPKFYQAHFNLGIAYREKGDTAKALVTLETAKSLAPDDQTKTQIQTAMDRASGAPSDGAGSFREKIEKRLRSHDIVGPKIVRFDWPSSAAGRVYLDRFPMDQMPEAIRDRFLGRLESDLAEAARASGAEGEASLELVDNATGRVMATVRADSR